MITLLPDDDVAVAVVTNVGGREMGERACRELTSGVLDRLGVPKTSADEPRVRPESDQASAPVVRLP